MHQLAGPEGCRCVSVRGFSAKINFNSIVRVRGRGFSRNVVDTISKIIGSVEFEQRVGSIEQKAMIQEVIARFLEYGAGFLAAI